MDMIGLGASAASGGLFGLLGTIAGRVIGVFERREARADAVLAYRHDEARWRHEIELQQLQMRARAEETEDERALIQMAGSYEGLTASLRADAVIRAPAWVDAVRGMVRPVLTPLLWVAVMVIFFRTASAEARWIAEAERSELLGYIANSIVFAATAATLWWFGDRPSAALRKPSSL